MAGRFAPLVARFLKDLRARGYALRTIDGYRLSLDRLAEHLEARGIQTIDDVTPQALADYQTSLITDGGRRGQPLTLAAQQNLLTHARLFFRFLVRHGYLLMDPGQHLAVASPPWRPPQRILSLNDVKRLLQAPDTKTPRGIRDRAILERLYSTGIRASELAGLDLFDVDVTEGELRVRRGKGGKSRLIPIGRMACRWLTRYLKDARPELALRPREIALFVSYTGRRLHRVNLAKILRLYGKAAGIKIKTTPHTIRHTFATHMLKGHASLRHLQEMLGHAKLSTTQIYTKVDISDLKAVHRRCHPRGRK